LKNYKFIGGVNFCTCLRSALSALLLYIYATCFKLCKWMTKNVKSYTFFGLLCTSSLFLIFTDDKCQFSHGLKYDSQFLKKLVKLKDKQKDLKLLASFGGPLMAHNCEKPYFGGKTFYEKMKDRTRSWDDLFSVPILLIVTNIWLLPL